MVARIGLFVLTNLLVIATVTPLLMIFGAVHGSVGLFVVCFLYGMVGALVSLALSKLVAKWVLRVRVLNPSTTNSAEARLVGRVHDLARRAGLTTMPDVGVYESEEINAFATGPTRNWALVAVSSELLNVLHGDELDAVLAHEIEHIANGDMITMALLQGVMNAFVMFFARRIAGAILGNRGSGHFRFMVIQALQFALGLLGSLVTCWFSRQREFRADAGGARLVSRQAMIGALEQIHGAAQIEDKRLSGTLAAFKISHRGSFFAELSTHPPLEERIAALRALP